MSDRNYMFLRIPKFFWLKDIKLYIKGGNSNKRHFNYSGIKYKSIIERYSILKGKKLQSMKVKHQIPWLPYGYKPWKKSRQEIQCQATNIYTRENTDYHEWLKIDWAKHWAENL